MIHRGPWRETMALTPPLIVWLGWNWSPTSSNTPRSVTSTGTLLPTRTKSWITGTWPFAEAISNCDTPGCDQRKTVGEQETEQSCAMYQMPSIDETTLVTWTAAGNGACVEGGSGTRKTRGAALARRHVSATGTAVLKTFKKKCGNIASPPLSVWLR